MGSVLSDIPPQSSVENPLDENFFQGGPWAVGVCAPRMEKAIAHRMLRAQTDEALAPLDTDGTPLPPGCPAPITKTNAVRQAAREHLARNPGATIAFSPAGLNHSTNPNSHATSSPEKTAGNFMADLPYGYFLPLVERRSKSRNKIVTSMFPGYIFLRGQYTGETKAQQEQIGRAASPYYVPSTDQDFTRAYYAAGGNGATTSAGRSGGLSAVLTTADQGRLRNELRLLMVQQPTPDGIRIEYDLPKAGRAVEIASGPLEGLRGFVDTMHPNKDRTPHNSSAQHRNPRIFVELLLMGQVISAEVDASLEYM